MKIQWRRRRASFTLVELLVVIAIIGVLTALVVGIATGALAKARWARIKIELDNLAGALEAYKNEFGSYPPSQFDTMAARDLVRLHMQKRYPRWNSANWTVPALSEAQALVFWLRNHSTNPLDPFDMGTISRGAPFFDFNQTRLIDPSTGQAADASVLTYTAANIATYPYYVPDGGQGMPYIYFSAESYLPTLPTNAMALPPRYSPAAEPNGQGKGPYMSAIISAGVREWVNPGTFQLLSAGPDGNWGMLFPAAPTAHGFQQPIYPTGNGYEGGDLDNVTNFCSTSLEAAQ